MKLEYSYLSRIRIKEIPGMVNGVVRIVENYNPETLGVKPLFDLVLEQQQKLELLTDPFVGHPLTPHIQADRKRMVELAQAIVIQSRAVNKAKISTKSDAAFMIAPLVKKHLLKIVKNNSKVTEKSVTSFLNAVSGSPELKQAATSTGINDYVDELGVLKNRIDLNCATRNADNSARRIKNELNLKSAVLSAISNLLKAIDLAQVHNTTVDYRPMIAELNQFFVPFMALTRSRSTRNKNAEIKKTVASSPKTTATA